MPGLSLDLKLTNLQKKNYNSIALEVWDITKGAGTVNLNNFAVELQQGRVTVQWGDNTQNTSGATTINANKTYT